MRSARSILPALAAVAGFFVFLSAGPANAVEHKDIVLRGDAKCTRCHDEGDDYPVLAIGQTAHGMRGDARTPTCTSCHGESDAHVTNTGGGDTRPKPDRVFGLKGKASEAHVQNQACLSCHESAARMHWKGSPHETNDVSCASCHTIHTGHDPVLAKQTQPEVCYKCHKDKRATMQRISHHPVPEGKMACSSCHNPHGGGGDSNLVQATVNETCYTCHAEKRGPFLIEHPPAREDCTNCHNPHGTNNPPLLKARVPWLCQSCHSAEYHPSTAYGGQQVPPNGVAQQLLAKGCTNCHQQVHGSNHPSGWRWTR